MPWSIINLNSARGAKYREYGSWLVGQLAGVSDRQSHNQFDGGLTDETINFEKVTLCMIGQFSGWLD